MGQRSASLRGYAGGFRGGFPFMGHVLARHLGKRLPLLLWGGCRSCELRACFARMIAIKDQARPTSSANWYARQMAGLPIFVQRSLSYT